MLRKVIDRASRPGSETSASGDLELKRYNLIFAENGRGKTTFRDSAIRNPFQRTSRSVTLGDAERHQIRLGGGSTPRQRRVDRTLPGLASSLHVPYLRMSSGDAVRLGTGEISV
jgi:hypothetical protein